MNKGFALGCLVCLLLFLPSGLADQLLYSEWHYSGDSFEIDEEGYDQDIYYLSYFVQVRNTDNGPGIDETGIEQANNRLLMKKNNKGFTLVEGECKIEPLIKYCFEDADWYDKESQGHLKYEHGDEYPGLKISVYKIGPTLEVTRTSEDMSLNLNQPSAVKIMIKNTGDRRASDAAYTERPPKTVDTYGVSGFTTGFLLNHDYLEWLGSLPPNEKLYLQYNIKPITYESFKIPATLFYSYEGVQSNQSILDLAFTVITPYSFTSAVNPTTVNINELATYNVLFKNEDMYDTMDVLVRISIPKELQLVRKPLSLNQENDFWLFQMKLLPLTSFNFDIDLRGTATGSYNISTYGEFRIRDEEIQKKLASMFTISTDKVEPTVRFSEESVEAGTKVRVKALLENKDDSKIFVKIKGTLSSSFLSTPIEISDADLDQEEVKLYIDQDLTTPITNKKLEYRFDFTGSYETIEGEKYNFSTFKILTVNPGGGDVFEITQDVSDGLVIRGENITVKTSVKNLKNFKTTRVNVSDSVPEGLQIVGGTNKNFIDLDALEKKQAYLYRLEVPKEFLDQEFTINSQVSYQEYNFEASKTITVLDAPNATTPIIENTTQINTTWDDNNSSGSGDNSNATKSKESLLTRIANAIEDFFNILIGRKK
ncbi:MAG: hypothetical protein V1743_04975 [Nanoarchaeota archaeon]